jgi:hypothetical protein
MGNPYPTTAQAPGNREAIRQSLFSNCRVGATHQVFLGLGGLHPPDNELTGWPLSEGNHKLSYQEIKVG